MKMAKIFKIIATIFVICIIVIAARFFSSQPYGLSENFKNQLQENSDSQSLSNKITKVFDLSEDYDQQIEKEMKEEIAADNANRKGADFFYRTMVDQQMKIDNLSKEIDEIKRDFRRYKKMEQVTKTIFTYVDLRKKIFDGENYYEELKNFELLVIFDDHLKSKLVDLKNIIQQYPGERKIREQFKKLIPQLIANKSNSKNPSFGEKIYKNLSQLVTIRKTNESGYNNFDSLIVKIENALAKNHYNEAKFDLALIKENNAAIISEFYKTVENAAKLQDIDREIIEYLKSSN